jgi:Ca2+-binding EF-hand superfamily protein
MPSSRYVQTPTFTTIRTSVTLAKQAIRAADADRDGRLTRAELNVAVAAFEQQPRRKYAGGLLEMAWGRRANQQAARLSTMERALDRFEATLHRADLNGNQRLPETELQKMKDREPTSALYGSLELWGASR